MTANSTKLNMSAAIRQNDNQKALVMTFMGSAAASASGGPAGAPDSR